MGLWNDDLRFDIRCSGFIPLIEDICMEAWSEVGCFARVETGLLGTKKRGMAVICSRLVVVEQWRGFLTWGGVLVTAFTDLSEQHI